jgi:hypothetical protein
MASSVLAYARCDLQQFLYGQSIAIVYQVYIMDASMGSDLSTLPEGLMAVLQARHARTYNYSLQQSHTDAVMMMARLHNVVRIHWLEEGKVYTQLSYMIVSTSGIRMCLKEAIPAPPTTQSWQPIINHCMIHSVKTKHQQA